MTLEKDTITELLGAKIQHGPLNHRIYLMALGDAPPDELVPQLDRLARENRYTKIFAKVPRTRTAPFIRAGYREEASVPGFFAGEEDAAFLGFYLDDTRRTPPNRSELDRVIETARRKQRPEPPETPAPAGVALRVCEAADIEEMARLYRAVFPSYPFPIQDPGYLLETMRSHVVYFCAEERGRIVALSSAEMDEGNLNVEMTDFATDVAWRGRRLASHLLFRMEAEIRRRGILTAYTISRAISHGINITFSSMGYAYGGLLINNTNISGQIESMTVWHKRLGPMA